MIISNYNSDFIIENDNIIFNIISKIETFSFVLETEKIKKLFCKKINTKTREITERKLLLSCVFNSILNNKAIIKVNNNKINIIYHDCFLDFEIYYDIECYKIN
jgi:hypothetical protein